MRGKQFGARLHGLLHYISAKEPIIVLDTGIASSSFAGKVVFPLPEDAAGRRTDAPIE
jgi:hypothetical protein